ncbi:MAG: hypothetical protein KR126chlam3_00839 [Chlamydiae bacterium]|nr:hypothetical protein [Chlamydiota bacterium]
MQQKASQPSDENAIKKELQEALEQIDVLQKQSLNLFDKPKVYHRAFQILDAIDAKIHDLNHLFPEPNSEENRAIQDLFFSVKEMRETIEDLKSNSHKLEFQQKFIESINRIKDDINNL